MAINKVDVAFTAAWESNKFVILDTETTGLHYPAEIVQICILDFMGNTILDTYVKPHKSIPTDATRIHGITDGMVENAPTWPEVRQQVIDALASKHLIIYNATYDLQMLRNSDKLWGLYFDWTSHINELHCAMLWYARLYGEWNDYMNGYRWHKLSVACSHRGITSEDAHDAHGDCVMVHKLVSSIMVERAKKEVIYSEGDLIVCTHPVKDDTMNGQIVCRDCGKTWDL